MPTTRIGKKLVRFIDMVEKVVRLGRDIKKDIDEIKEPPPEEGG